MLLLDHVGQRRINDTFKEITSVMSKANITGIKEVASYANVSISTVSNVLNGSKNVSKELQKRVYDAVKTLGYEVNPIASGLKTGKTNTIGVLVPTIANVFYPPLLQSIHQAALMRNYNVSIYETRQDFEYEKRYINAFRSKWVDGIILTSCVNTDCPESKKYVEELLSLNSNGKLIPVVCIDVAIDDRLDAVVANNREAMCQAAQHLIDMGRRNIAYVAAPVYFENGKDRRAGYLDALAKNNLPFCPEMICEGDFSPQSGARCMRTLLSRSLKIDGVLAGNDQMGVGVIWALKEAGIDIPDQVAVIGFDDNFPASLISPSLSAMHVSKEELGRQAFTLLHKRMTDPDVSATRIVLPTQLIVRQSTDIAAASVWDLDNW